MFLFEVSGILQTKKGNFLKVCKFTCIIFVVMLIVAAFSVFNVKPTTVENTNVSAGYVKAGQTYVLVLNFTINTTSDTLLAGLGPSVGQILENDNQSTDWGGAGKMWYYDNSSGSPGGGWDVSIDCIFLDNTTNNSQYNTGETVLAGLSPPNGTAGTGWGCKNMSAWHRVKSYDAADGGVVWNVTTDAIIFEGEDNNTCYHDELNAVTFKLNGTCNGTSSDISDLTFWVENTGGGFSSSDDTLLGNASFSADSFSWNISDLAQDINVTATFYAAVNLSATAVHWNTIRMDIPTKIDNVTTGLYTPDDQGVFLAGTNDTGNVVNTNNLTIDTSTPTATVTVPVNGNYYNSLTSVSGSCNDSVSDISGVNITIFNVTGGTYWNGSTALWDAAVSWISTTLGGDYDTWSNSTSSISWTNNSQYRVNATATDNGSNVGATDSNSFTFDNYAPTISSLSPASGSSTTNTQPTISAALSDSGSGVDNSSVIIKVDNVNQTSNATVTYSSISYTPASALSYASHTVNVTVSDNASNTGYSEWSFTVYAAGGNGGDTGGGTGGGTIVATGPTITIDMPADGSTIYDRTPTIKASYSDISGIDADSVTLTIDEVTVTPTITLTLVTYTPTTDMTFGEHNVKVNVSDVLGNSATKDWSFTILQSESISEEEVGNVTSGEETEVELENSDETGIECIMFTAKADLTNVKITVVKLSGKPEYIAEDPTKVVTIYAYLEIEITADDKYVADDDIESLKIRFKVEQTWMKENNIDKETIVLMKYHNNEWQKLPTTVISEDAVYVYFESETTGFSTFAIAVSEGKEPTEELETPGLPLLIIIGAIIAAIIIIIVILYKKGYINIR
jgi:PGF-pre-PGF domain-containing protein